MTISWAGSMNNWRVWIPTSPDRLAALREAIIGPLRNVYGVADKVLAMAMSNLLLAAGKPKAAVARSRRDVRRRRHPRP